MSTTGTTGSTTGSTTATTGASPTGPGAGRPGWGRVPSAVAVAASRGRVWRRYRADRTAMVASLFLLAIVVVGVLAPWLAPHDPTQQDLVNAYAGPSGQHWLGTDELGRDELSRMIDATRTSLLAIGEAIAIASALGIPIGLAAGFLGGWVDRIVMRLTDLLFALPALVLVMLVIAIFGTGLVTSMAALGVVFATGFVRVTRNAVLAVRSATYVEAAQVIGLSTPTIIVRHVLPNALGPIVVQVVTQAGVVVTVEASLSFIGLGVQPPQASWGTLLATAATSIHAATSLLIVWPGVAIAVTVLALNLVGDGLLSAIQPGRERARPRRTRRAAVVATPALPAGAVTPPPGDGDALLRVDRLTVGVGTDGPTLVSDVSFAIRPGEVVGLVGESGCGKSTIALALMGLLDDQRLVTGGSIRLGERELVGLPEREWQGIRGSEIAMVFQNPLASLNPTMTIGDQVAEPLRLAGTNAKAAREQAIALLDQVGVTDPARRAGQYPHMLSGGMAQRAMIAMAVAGRPKLLIADEPVTALDVRVREQVLDLLLDLRDELDLAVLLVTHDLGVVADACDRTVVAYAGQVVEQAPVEDLFDRPLHPYTHGLLGARPTRLAVERLTTIPGAVPLPGRWPAGCRFQPRCAHAHDACAQGPVDLALVTPEHAARCVISQEAPWN